MNTAIVKGVEEGNLYEIEDMVSAALAGGKARRSCWRR
jgi:hypothetical protein